MDKTQSLFMILKIKVDKNVL